MSATQHWSNAFSLRGRLMSGMAMICLLFVCVLGGTLWAISTIIRQNQAIGQENRHVIKEMQAIAVSIGETVAQQNQHYEQLLQAEQAKLFAQLDAQQQIADRLLAIQKALTELQLGVDLIIIDNEKPSAILPRLEAFTRAAEALFSLEGITGLDEKIIKDAKRGQKAYLSLFDEIRQMEETGAGFNNYITKASQARALGREVHLRFEKLLTATLERHAASIEGKKRELADSIQKMSQDGAAATATIQGQQRQIIQVVTRNTDRIQQSVDAMQRRTPILFGVCALVVFLACLLAWLIAHTISRPLDHLTTGLSLSADTVSRSADNLLTISSASSSISLRLKASVAETVTSVDQIAALVHRNSDNTSRARQLMDAATRAAQEANQQMDSLARAMHEIAEASGKTSAIVKTIDTIAFQTNLLALNASVEAARAGEAGAGFAVVADEVRNLAARAAAAAKETATLIALTSNRVVEGTGVQAKTVAALREVTDEVTQANGVIQEVSLSSQEQVQGLSLVERTTEEMKAIIDDNSQIVEQSSQSASDLGLQAEQMFSYCQALTQLTSGSNGRSIPPVPRSAEHERLALPG